MEPVRNNDGSPYSDRLWYESEAPTRISDEQRKALRDKTGFEGYTAFLRDYNNKDSICQKLLAAWEIAEHTPAARSDKVPNPHNCGILDLIKDQDSSMRFDRLITESNSVLFTALSEPRKGLYGRIVFWRIPRGKFRRTNFLEDLGLVLNISPTFVKSLYTKCYPEELGFTHIPGFVANHVMVGDALATMTRCHIGEGSSAVPIVLIADTTDLALDPRNNGSQKMQQHGIFHLDIDLYGEMIMHSIERNDVFSKSADNFILPALLAGLHMDAHKLRSFCDYTPPKFKRYRIEDSIEAKTTYGNELRRRLEDFEDIMQDALAGFSSLYGANWSGVMECESTVEYFTQIINRARRFEANLRDTCQVKIGRLSLEESRKSVKLSTSQAEEGQRGELPVHCNKGLSLTGLSQDM